MAIWNSAHPAHEGIAKASKNTAVEALGMEYVDVGDDYVTGRIPMGERTVQPGFYPVTAALSRKGLTRGGKKVRFATKATHGPQQT